MIGDWLKKVICPACIDDGDGVAGVATEIGTKLDTLIETGETQLEETRSIRLELSTIRQRIAASDFPFLGDNSAANAGR